MSEKNKVVNLKPKKISTAVNKAVNSGFEVNIEGDDALFSTQNYNWNDLLSLKEEIANSVMAFTIQVSEMANNTDILANLGDNLQKFTATIQVFFRDINDFSERVKTLREQHEHLSGPVMDMDSFNLYNRLAFEYHSLCNELTILVGPTISQLVMLTSESADKSVVLNTVAVETKEEENE